jgi:hypothetical protein
MGMLFDLLIAQKYQYLGLGQVGYGSFSTLINYFFSRCSHCDSYFFKIPTKVIQFFDPATPAVLNRLTSLFRHFSTGHDAIR